jgi:hypothetical protein
MPNAWRLWPLEIGHFQTPIRTVFLIEFESTPIYKHVFKFHLIFHYRLFNLKFSQDFMVQSAEGYH